MTETRIDSTEWMGSHLSLASSYPYWSSPGWCRIEMQTSPLRAPSGYTFGW